MRPLLVGITASGRRQGAPYILSALVLVMGCALSYLFAHAKHQADYAQRRQWVRAELDKTQGDLSRELFAAVYLTQGIASLIAMEGDLSKERFEGMTRRLLEHHPLIRNLAAAPNNVITYVHPLEGNEAAIGTDLMEVPDQRATVQRAMSTGRIVVTGPVTLVQGGRAIIGRTPVFTGGVDEEPRYWGMLSTVVDFERLLKASGIDGGAGDLQIAIRCEEAAERPGEPLFGGPEVLESDPVSMAVPLPSGSWQIAAIPRGGWRSFQPLLSLVLWFGVTLSLAFAALFLKVLLVSNARERLAEERSAAVHGLEQARSELEDRVIERTEELEKAKERAESADRTKSAFLATMSHELRTPLNSILGFTGILLQGLAGGLNEEQDKQLGMVQHSARHLLALINDVLDISKIEAGQLQVALSGLDLPKTIEAVFDAVAPLATKKGLELEQQLQPEVGQVWGDPLRVEQVLMNLLSNAIKFTETGKVWVEGSVDGSMVEIRVCDTGIGISAQDLDHLFVPFSQVDTGLARRHEGTGLGLFICKRLMDLMGGTVGVRSEVDKGSTFTVRFPIEESGA